MDIKDYNKIAEYNDFILSENAPKIIKVKDMLGVGIKCPCEPDNKSRYCGSKLCVKETQLTGKCHCGMFLTKEN